MQKGQKWSFLALSLTCAVGMHLGQTLQSFLVATSW